LVLFTLFFLFPVCGISYAARRHIYTYMGNVAGVRTEFLTLQPRPYSSRTYSVRCRAHIVSFERVAPCLEAYQGFKAANQKIIPGASMPWKIIE
jgi:hypothetical protein